ncbi:DUF6069 family protein [Nocardioides KLBMP 9356]|uniref:DUF6069 family protein n=1 Tax=Nocardioides potassii TaxID=2911371 RepID=A0ABS9HEU3_9ACTN|nr:DUF6069 family protein [Nocardioides potassii]MCF6378739.1 DUF6069 family protein [Nocardioides potassii]
MSPRTGLLAVAGATGAAAVVAGVARAAGVDLAVDGSDETIPVSGVAVMTAGFTLVGVAMALGFQRWSARPADRFLVTAAGLTALSLVPPVLWGADGAAVGTLVALHLVAAAVAVPVLARGLRHPRG